MYWWPGLYFVVVTATTVGYGDTVVHSEGMKCFAICWIVLVTVRWVLLAGCASVSADQTLGTLQSKE